MPQKGIKKLEPVMTQKLNYKDEKGIRNNFLAIEEIKCQNNQTQTISPNLL